jgi:hypothetical protein
MYGTLQICLLLARPTFRVGLNPNPDPDGRIRKKIRLDLLLLFLLLWMLVSFAYFIAEPRDATCNCLCGH